MKTNTAKFKSAAILALVCFYGNGATHSHARSIARAWLKHAHSFDGCGARGCDPWCWPKGAWPLGMRMSGGARRVVGSNPIWDSDFFRIYVSPRIYVISITVQWWHFYREALQQINNKDLSLNMRITLVFLFGCLLVCFWRWCVFNLDVHNISKFF